LFIYVNKKSAERPEIQKFVEFYMAQGAELTSEVGYIPLPANAYKLAWDRFSRRVTGSVFGGKGSQVGVSIETLLSKDK
ncbi:MAG TPA: protein sphX, partial [Candidatus Tripitaka sp. YC43]